MTTELRNIGSLITVARAGANAGFTAGAAGDNTEVVGVIIDRAAIGWPESAVFAVPYTATLAATERLEIGALIASGNNSGLSDAATLLTVAKGTVATGPAGGGTVTGTFEVSVSLRGAGRYVRANYTPDLSRANTDTAALSAVLVFAGANRLPQ
jgi:hypothetical protein